MGFHQVFQSHRERKDTDGRTDGGTEGRRDGGREGGREEGKKGDCVVGL